ncbi:MAG: hypothetical protein ACK5MT_16030 [Actinomycetales bacterium]
MRRTERAAQRLRAGAGLGARLRRVAAPALIAGSGIALAAYPVVRPRAREVGLSGAEAFAGNAWLIAHCLGMVGFVLLAFGLRALADAEPTWWLGRPVREAETRGWLAVALLLPYYGAEAFALNVAGRHAVAVGDVTALEALVGFRFAPVELVTFGMGLLALAMVGGRLILGAWASGTLGRTGGILAGLGLLTYLPQFFTPMPVRIAHGVVLGTGLCLLAWTMWTERAGADMAAR